MSTQSNVLIAGAGPAGMATALRLAQLGVKDILLVDAADFPRDKTCGSGLSPSGIETLRDLGIWDEVEPLAYWIHGMRLVTPNGSEIMLPAEGVEAAVCLRRTLDHAILKAAIANGVRFEAGVRVNERIEENGRTVGLRTRDGREFRANQTVIATGAMSPLTVEPVGHTRIMAIMGWWEGAEFEDNWLEMVYDHEISPYYGWLFPEGPNRVNIGITYVDEPGQKRHARKLFERFLERQYGSRLTNATRLGAYRGHPVHTRVIPPKLHTPGRWVVGEAGRMVHPATAEGIGPGMRSGILLAEALAAVEAGRSEGLAAMTYRARCIKTFSPGFAAGNAFLGAAKRGWLDKLAGMSQSPRWQKMTQAMFVKM